MYLDRMDYHESFDSKSLPMMHTYTFKGPCVQCNAPQSITVIGPDLFKFRQGEHIQNAFPYLTGGEREMLMSGICDNCWDKMFPEEEE